MRSETLDDPALTLDRLLSRWPETARVFLKYKMLCVGCMVSPFHTVIDACLEYGLDEDMFRGELRRAILR